MDRHCTESWMGGAMAAGGVALCLAGLLAGVLGSTVFRPGGGGIEALWEAGPLEELQ